MKAAMPITDTLQNARRLESKGIRPEAAQEISSIVEEAAQAGQQDLKDFIRDGLASLENNLESRLGARIEAARAETKENYLSLKVEMHSLARDQLLKFIAVLIMSLTLAVAIIKLFPNA